MLIKPERACQTVVYRQSKAHLMITELADFSMRFTGDEFLVFFTKLSFIKILSYDKHLSEAKKSCHNFTTAPVLLSISAECPECCCEQDKIVQKMSEIQIFTVNLFECKCANSYFLYIKRKSYAVIQPWGKQKRNALLCTI